MNNEKVYLMIIDGFGEGKKYEGNAIDKANTPNIDRFKKDYPSTTLKAAGNEVGLPEGTIGNSEVGHYTIGAGRIVYQSLEMINRSIKDGSFYNKAPLLDSIKKIEQNGSLHLLGLISDEGVHAHTDHLFALLELAKKHSVSNIFIHAITDGRDVAERSAKKYISMIQDKITKLGLEDHASIATIVGRYYAMDRDQNWDRTEQAYNLYTLGTGTAETDALTAIDNAYATGAETDYYIKPIILNKDGLFHDEDSVIFFNFRTDRPRQLTQALTGEEKIGFQPQKEVHPYLVCFGDYSETAPIVFPPDEIKNNLAQTLENAGAKQLHIAETEKYAHVTYFFNSQIEAPFPHEDRIMIPSPKVESFDQTPAMSAKEITDRAIEEIEKGSNNFIVQNFANPDLVGHSGKLEATIQACEVIDECVGRIAEACLKNGYQLIITADHGNAEYMIYEENGEPCPSHTENPVPCILVSNTYKDVTLKTDQGLKDIAPTVLNIMDIDQPQEMTGTSLIT
ncbi:2,3-bisphosphoglycerate-independent phosphoglycerate mutase [Candidatus Peregrinibacteria bacterium]|nr:2,3-bisphosphoglycerate-independent phosphoglycerate mutase [Candidatus Peregrinibacteria bacterium]